MKLGKDENKPFKRQSYHVAIAYHIHLKQVKNTKSVEYVDPTYPARKLREQTQPESKKNWSTSYFLLHQQLSPIPSEFHKIL